MSQGLHHLNRAHGPTTHGEIAAALCDQGFDRGTSLPVPPVDLRR